jgi:hypothetical protein
MNERNRFFQKLTTEGFRLKKWHVVFVLVFFLGMTLSELADLSEVIRSEHRTWVVAASYASFVFSLVATASVAAVLYINYDSLEW